MAEKGHRAGLFDLRLIIAVLFGVYGVVLTIVGLGFTSDEDLAKADGLNINLWSGLGCSSWPRSSVCGRSRSR